MVMSGIFFGSEVPFKLMDHLLLNVLLSAPSIPISGIGEFFSSYQIGL
jgi:hypothetical protein